MGRRITGVAAMLVVTATAATHAQTARFDGTYEGALRVTQAEPRELGCGRVHRLVVRISGGDVRLQVEGQSVSARLADDGLLRAADRRSDGRTFALEGRVFGRVVRGTWRLAGRAGTCRGSFSARLQNRDPVPIRAQPAPPSLIGG